jgi:hypothetical protein
MTLEFNDILLYAKVNFIKLLVSSSCDTSK